MEEKHHIFEKLTATAILWEAEDAKTAELKEVSLP